MAIVKLLYNEKKNTIFKAALNKRKKQQQQTRDYTRV